MMRLRVTREWLVGRPGSCSFMRRTLRRPSAWLPGDGTVRRQPDSGRESVRHFRSILYALVLAPAVWVLAGVGFTHDLTARGRDDFAVESVAGLLLLVLAGAAYAILLFAPISPAGPLVGGLAYLGISAWALAAPAAYAGVWPEAVAKEGFDISR